MRCVIAFGSHQPTQSRYCPAITLLKPVCGMEPGLYENLRSFCDQDYPDYQVVFGVRDAQDPAIAVIERIIKEFPQRDLSLVARAVRQHQIEKTSFGDLPAKPFS